MIYLLVGVGGAIGSLLRYSISLMTINLLTTSFPIATLITNFLGSFILGWLTHSMIKKNNYSPQLMTALGTGLIGSFTTFSTFSVETIQLFEGGQYLLGILYILLSIMGGLLLSFIGSLMSTKRKEVNS
ncbi:CrcB protein [Bacillus pakistanensis]|uniref:Fluoride-specific ion channel FluC n=1 Tax=Rossellomorea pakistanensis TaxID=992288 RepID=A0ABS2N8E5_9BACI|nr:fluoride efflux transporter CrcB [Bacillus pakistanensis]MBM7584114.1 CrcB protein [Bacillus pakistanensis]